MSSIEVGDRVILKHGNDQYVCASRANIGRRGAVLRVELPSRQMRLYVVQMDGGGLEQVEAPNLCKIGG